MKVDHFLRYYADYPAEWRMPVLGFSSTFLARTDPDEKKNCDDLVCPAGQRPPTSRKMPHLACDAKRIVQHPSMKGRRPSYTPGHEQAMGMAPHGRGGRQRRPVWGSHRPLQSGRGRFPQRKPCSARLYQERSYESREAWERWTPAEWEEWHRSRNYNRDPQERNYRPSNPSSWQKRNEIWDWHYDYGGVDQYQ